MSIRQHLRQPQIEGLDKILNRHGKCGVFAEMGTGKTRLALAAVDELGAKRILVVCPLSVTSVWKNELKKVELDWPVTDLTARTGVPKKAAEVRQTGDGLMLVNYESYWRKPLNDRLLLWKPDAVILDEAHRVRHRGARQSRFAHRLGDRVDIRLPLTGTPIGNGIEDIWSIYRFFDFSVFGRYPDFARRYIIPGTRYPGQILGYDNTEEIREIMQATSYQCSKDEAALPDRTDVPMTVTMAPATRKAYDDLKRDAIVQLEDADGKPKNVVAQIVLTMILRLQQITGGFVTADDGTILDLSDEKARVAVDLVGDAVAQKERVAVFARFIHDLDVLQLRLTQQGHRVARLDGSVDGPDREYILKQFHNGAYDVILLQTRVGSVGIDLTAASIGIFYSTGFSLDDFLQARDRIHRHGQTRPVTYYHLLADNSVDSMIYAALQSKASIARMVTDLSYARSLFR